MTADALPLDNRIHPFRPDLAAAHLRRRLNAPAFATPIAYTVSMPTVPVRGAGDCSAPMVTEFLFGESVLVYQIADGWAWGQSCIDGYVGYFRADALVRGVAPPTHRIAAVRAHGYAAPNLKSRPLVALSQGSLVHVTAESGDWRRILGLDAWIHRSALARPSQRREDIAATAERFLHVPYLWGGRSALGLDCSGLVQRSLLERGMAAPRDSDQQQSTGSAIEVSGWSAQRGDLVFFPGHVGIMVDAVRIIHANATAMAVSIDPVDEVADRIQAAEGTGITAIRRLDDPIAPSGTKRQ